MIPSIELCSLKLHSWAGLLALQSFTLSSSFPSSFFFFLFICLYVSGGSGRTSESLEDHIIQIGLCVESGFPLVNLITI